jgi:hypothetical protein
MSGEHAAFFSFRLADDLPQRISGVSALLSEN